MKYLKNFYQNLQINLRPNLNELVSDFLKIKNDYIFLLIAAIGFLLRLVHLSQPIKGDETATFIYYVEPINPLRVFIYTNPNNHVLHTILTKISTSLFGNSVVAMRIPSLLASIGIIYFVYAICKRFGQNGVFGALTTAIWPYLIAYSNNSRGYSLFCLLSLILVYIYIISRAHFNNFALILIALISSFGIFTIPTFIFITLGIYIWISIDYYFFISEKRNGILEINLLLILFTFLFSVILYLPVFFLSPNGYLSVLNNKNIINRSLSFESYVNQIFPHIRKSLIEISQMLPNFYICILLILFFLGLYFYLNDKKTLELILFPSIIISSISVITFKLVIPPERTWIFLVPYFLIVVDNGFSRFLINIKNIKNLFVISVLIIFSITILKPLLSKDFIDIEENALPEASIAIKFLESQRIINKKDRLNIYYLSGDSMPLNYYNLLFDAKISVNSNRIYTRKSIVQSFKDDLKRFLNSEFQSNSEKVDKYNYFIVNNRYDLHKDINFSYEELVKKYPLKMKAGKLEIYSAKEINSKDLT